MSRGIGYRGARHVRSWTQLMSGHGSARAYTPHPATSARVIQRGDLGLLELATVVDGYWSDLTRTLGAGAPPSAYQDELYAAIRSLEWRHFLSAERTLAIKATCRSSRLTHSQFIALKTKDAIVIRADFAWSDVGSWSVAYELNPKDRNGNVRPARSLCVDSHGNMIVSPDKFVVTVGVRDLAIIDTGDALLVSALGRSQDVGKAVKEMEEQGRDDLL